MPVQLTFGTDVFIETNKPQQKQKIVFTFVEWSLSEVQGQKFNDSVLNVIVKDRQSFSIVEDEF